MMRQVRTAGYGWLAMVEELEHENAEEAARLPHGVKESCEIMIGRSADVELALGDTLQAVRTVHRALEAITLEPLTGKGPR